MFQEDIKTIKQKKLKYSFNLLFFFIKYLFVCLWKMPFKLFFKVCLKKGMLMQDNTEHRILVAPSKLNIDQFVDPC